MNTAALRTRAPRPEDLPAVLDLFRLAFGKNVSPAHYQWKLRSRASPTENVVIAVDEMDRPVFHSAGIPCRCRIGGAERWVMLGAEVMTAPAYQRRGLNTRFSSEMYARWQDAGVALVLGFTNQHWGSSARKVGLRPLGPLASLVLPLRPGQILARKTGLSVFGKSALFGKLWRTILPRPSRDQGLHVEEVRSPDGEFDELWQNAAPGIERSLVRDQDWVRWRYFESPDIRYRILLARRGSSPAGYVALAQPDPRVGTIVEIFAGAGDPAVFATLLRAALDAFLATDTEVVRTLAAQGSWPYRGFRRHGFLVRGKGVVEHIRLDPSLSPRDLGEAKDWLFAAGDFDAV